jgi:hypothetical protein
MSLFGSIVDKIFHHSSDQPGATARTGSSAQTSSAPSAAAQTPPQTTAPAGASAAGQQVDVESVLVALATQRGGGGNWRASIVDLLKLLELDSSLTARKQLADELDVHVGAVGSAEENIALHKAVMRKLAENGGKVPDSLKH